MRGRTSLLVVTSLFLLAVSILGACTTRTIPATDASFLDAGAVTDSGRRDAGPPVDGGPRLDDVLIYAHSRTQLFTFSPYTNTVVDIGMFRTSDGTGIENILDLAVDADGVVFVSGTDSLWRVEPTTAVVTLVGDFDIGSEELFALSFLTPSESPDGSEMLIGATNEGAYYEVDRDDASTGMLGQYPDGWSSSGDIVSIDGLGTFATLRRTDFPDSDVLARILFSSSGASVVTVVGPIEDGSEGFRQIFGLGYWGRDVYGFTNEGQLIRIDRMTGAAEVVSTATGSDSFWGAGVTTIVPVLI